MVKVSCRSWEFTHGYYVVFFTVFICIQSCACEALNTSATPQVIKIGALLSFNSTIGKVAKQAIQLAVRDVNDDGSVLNGSQLVLHMFDTTCSAFQAAAAAMELFKEEVVAVAGPQSSTVSHFLALMGSATQVPLVSFAATDPALSEYQYPFFFRVTHNDALQMQSMAAVIKYYGWQLVVALYTDDDFGANGIAVLDHLLEGIGSRIIKKEALASGIDRAGINTVLKQLAMMESRVFIVHMQKDVGLLLLSEASNLGFIRTGFVWIVTDLIAATLDTMELDATTNMSIQGIIGTRSYVPPSLRLQSFLKRYKQFQGQGVLDSSQVNVYGLYAYDSIWVIAHAIDQYLKHGQKFNFKDPPSLPNNAGGNSELAQMKISDSGILLQQEILQTRFKGITGPIEFDEKGDLIVSAFEIVNMVQEGIHVVGYWINGSGLSVSAPEDGEIGETHKLPASALNQGQLLDVLWPGRSNRTPRGWVFPQNGKQLIVGVPRKAGYKELVNEVDSSNSSTFSGYCIDVFKAAISNLSYPVSYKFVSYSNGDSTPDYDKLINQLANKVFDAVVGDITITSSRLKIVDFTQPYIESGLVVLVPIKNKQPNNLWAFLRPFTPAMWSTIGAFFLFTGAIIWMLEHKMNKNFRGQPKKQVFTVLWFIFSTLFFAHRERTKTTLGRAVLIIWLFVVLIITSSYTASLTSILTVQQLTPSIEGINDLITSDVPIGYQMGSFAKDYLIGLNINPMRLKPLISKQMYVQALKLGPNHGGVAAIVDETPYIQLFLASNCDFAMAGEAFTRSGWGFAFPKNSPLTMDVSEAILGMSERGELQKIHDSWFAQNECHYASNEVQSNELHLKSFLGLFLITGLASVFCLLVYMIRLIWQYKRCQMPSHPPVLETTSCISRAIFHLRNFANFWDRRDESLEGKQQQERKRKGKQAAGRLEGDTADCDSSVGRVIPVNSNG